MKNVEQAQEGETAIRRDFLAALKRAGSLRALGEQWGLSAAYLCDVKLGRREFGPTLLKQMGYRRVIVRSIRKEQR